MGSQRAALLFSRHLHLKPNAGPPSRSLPLRAPTASASLPTAAAADTTAEARSTTSAGGKLPNAEVAAGTDVAAAQAIAGGLLELDASLPGSAHAQVHFFE